MFDEIHNVAEDLVFSQVTEIFDSFEKGKGDNQPCTCAQCRRDVACYVLNRTAPHYVLSNRGVTRIGSNSRDFQQNQADIAALIHEGIEKVNHNRRPQKEHSSEPERDEDKPVFNMPTIMGRVFNGINFAPISEGRASLYRGDTLVCMNGSNWQNPYEIVRHTEGSFAFWPEPLLAETKDMHKIFEYHVKIEIPDFETLNHYFSIPVISEMQSTHSFSMERTFKLPDLYVFPPGEAELNG